MKRLPKLQNGDKVAIVSPSFAAPGEWPELYARALSNVRDEFDLVPVEFTVTKKVGASGEERARDLIAAFEDPDIKAVIASLGGNDQVTYIKKLPPEVFKDNPKPFFGFSDNSHFCNFLFLNNIPSFYGASLVTQFATYPKMDELTVSYLKKAFFEEGEFELRSADEFYDSNVSEGGELVDWYKPDTLGLKKKREQNTGWQWNGSADAQGLLWGGCIESIDEMLRHAVPIPSLDQFSEIVLMLESSEEMPTAEQVRRVIRAFGERGILERVKGVLVGRPKAWYFDRQHTSDEQKKFRLDQQAVIIETVRKYNPSIPVVQNLDFGHTDPQIPMPYGGKARIDSVNKKIFATF